MAGTETAKGMITDGLDEVRRKYNLDIPYPIEIAKVRFDMGKVITVFETWAVTDYGVECLTQYYAIPASRFDELNWPEHMREKSWVVYSDFKQAFDTAKRYHSRHKRSKHRSKITKAKRYRIMRRDNYTCQLCGATAKDDGVRLEIDHKHPLAGGGNNDESNLWTLCYPCNRGKGSRSL